MKVNDPMNELVTINALGEVITLWLVIYEPRAATVPKQINHKLLTGLVRAGEPDRAVQNIFIRRARACNKPAAVTMGLYSRRTVCW